MSSVAIIARAFDPGQIFIEAKDDGHPIKLVRRTLCLIGGNWIGEAAKNDPNPLATVRREVCTEELSLEKPTVSTLELTLLDDQPAGAFEYKVPVNPVEISPNDQDDLGFIKAEIWNTLAPFGTYLNTVTREAMTAADPENKRDGFTTLSCYWVSLLREGAWTRLERLQKKFGNLSNESITLITSADEIVEKKTRGAFCHEQPLQAFFLSMGVQNAKNMTITPQQTSVYAGPALASYDDYLAKYEIAKHP